MQTATKLDYAKTLSLSDRSDVYRFFGVSGERALKRVVDQGALERYEALVRANSGLSCIDRIDQTTFEAFVGWLRDVGLIGETVPADETGLEFQEARVVWPMFRDAYERFV